MEGAQGDLQGSDIQLRQGTPDGGATEQARNRRRERGEELCATRVDPAHSPLGNCHQADLADVALGRPRRQRPDVR
jgi:hypothetical protein